MVRILLVVFLFSQWGFAANTPQYNSVTPTLQVVVHPLLKRDSALHDSLWKNLQDLGADYIRYVPWLSFPRLSVPQLSRGNWDFSLVDPIVVDFLESTKGHPTVLNFSVIPQWMFVDGEKVQAPADPNMPFWDYQSGTKLQVPLRELGDYYKSLFEWYTSGGFVDRLGVSHRSGHFYDIPYWEVFNEVDGEHEMDPEVYTDRFNVIVDAIRSVKPNTKFVALALSNSFQMQSYLPTFLNDGHLKDGDMISFHFYGEEPWNKLFSQADRFIKQARKIAKLVLNRKKPLPRLGIMINELGTFSAREAKSVDDPLYWNMSAAFYAYTVANLANSGIQIIGESQLVGFPEQFPHVTMLNWETGRPNARFYVLKLLKDHLHRGDRVKSLTPKRSKVFAMSYTSALNCENVDVVAAVNECSPVRSIQNASQILVVNKTRKSTSIKLKGIAGSTFEFLDPDRPEDAPSKRELQTDRIYLKPCEVGVVIR